MKKRVFDPVGSLSQRTPYANSLLTNNKNNNNQKTTYEKSTNV